MYFLLKNGDIPASYVSLPEGKGSSDKTFLLKLPFGTSTRWVQKRSENFTCKTRPPTNSPKINEMGFTGVKFHP